MAARVPFGKNFTATSGPAADGKSASIRVRLADPPFLFYCTGTYTGTVTVETTYDSPDVSDTSASWVTIITFTSGTNPDQQNWSSPLYRVRGNFGAVASGGATCGWLEGIRGTKNPKGGRMTETQTSTL